MRSPLRTPVVIALFLLLFAFLYPLLGEWSANECLASEKILTRLALAQPSTPPEDKVLGGLLANTALKYSNGEMAEAAATQEWPHLPPQIGCTMLYWNLAIRGLPPPRHSSTGEAEPQ